MTTHNDTKAGTDEGPAFVMPGAVEDGAALWIGRHGQTEWSKSPARTPAAPTCRSPSSVSGRVLRSRRCSAALRPALVLSSPRERARRTADLAGLHVDELTEDLAEWHDGDVRGTHERGDP